MVRVRVAFFDLARRDAALGQLTRHAVSEVLSSGYLVGGEYVERFENDFARFLGVRHCIATSNGLDSLRLILQGMEIGNGDQVIVPAQTFIATWLAVSQLGAQPIPVDVDQFGLLDPVLLSDKLTPRTKAVIPVHLFGSPCDMDAIRDVLSGHDIPVIEDAAQAHGAEYKGETVGSLASASAFSFYPTKNLGAAGDAGAIATNDDRLAAEMRSLRSYGSGASKYEHSRLGWNCRMDSLQAAILTVHLPYLAEWNARRRQIAAAYDEVITGIEPSLVSRVFRPDGNNSLNANHLFVIRTPDRDSLRRRLEVLGVETDIHYPTPPFRATPFLKKSPLKAIRIPHMPEAEALSAQCLSLPLNPWLTDNEVSYVCETLSRALNFH